MKTSTCKDMESCSCFGEGAEGNENSTMNMKEGMGKCMKGAKWFMLIPGLILVSAFLLTSFLSPEAGQIFWLVITGTLFGLGLLFLTMINLWARKIKKQNSE